MMLSTITIMSVMMLSASPDGAADRAVAEAVAIAAVQEGLARHATTAEEALARLEACRWSPVYPDLEVHEKPRATR